MLRVVDCMHAERNSMIPVTASDVNRAPEKLPSQASMRRTAFASAQRVDHRLYQNA